MKRCGTCGVGKPLSEFCKDSQRKDGKSNRCRACASEYHSGYYQKNAEKVLKRTGAYYQENRDKYKVWSKEWEKDNPGRAKARFLNYRNRNLEICRERDRSYRLRNLSKDAARVALRKWAKRKRTPKWLTQEQKAEIQKFYDGARFLTELYGTPYHVDHIVPLRGKTVSGLHVPWNLQIISAEENIRKRNYFLGS